MPFQHEFVLSLLLTCNTTEISNRNEKKKLKTRVHFFCAKFLKICRAPLF